ncbi:hypothetical protein IAR50_003847 [Cryptococcus sp. DSM 104548]
MCYASSVPSNSSAEGLCCFNTDACATLICGAQNASIIYGETSLGGDITCLLNYTEYVNAMWSVNGSVDCGGTGCGWKDGVIEGSSAGVRMGGDMSGVLGIWAFTLCLLALASKKIY